MKNKLVNCLFVLGISFVLSGCTADKATSACLDTTSTSAEVIETETSYRTVDMEETEITYSTINAEETQEIYSTMSVEETEEGYGIVNIEETQVPVASSPDKLVQYIKNNYPNISISGDEIFTPVQIIGTPYYVDNYMYYTPTNDWKLERYDPWGGYTEHLYNGIDIHEKRVSLCANSSYSAEPTTKEGLHNIIKDYLKNNSGVVTDFHCINLNGNLGYSITVNKTESGVLDGTTLYFLVGNYLYSFDIQYNNEFIDHTTKNAGIASALNVISSFTVEPGYTNNHNDKFPCPANYDSQKYTWRETSISRDLYGMYQGYANAGKLFVGQTFDEIWQMMNDPSCDFDYENFWDGQFYKNCAREDIKFFADKGYDFLDLTMKISEAGYDDAVLYFASIGQPLLGKTTVADNSNTGNDVFVIYPDGYVTVGDAEDFKPFYDEQRAVEAFAMANEHRKANGLHELVWDEELHRAAKIRAAELAIYYSHTRPDGTMCNTVSDAINGENIAKGYPTSGEVVGAWMDSPGHRENILRSRYTKSAIAYYEINGEQHWCQLFGN